MALDFGQLDEFRSDDDTIRFTLDGKEYSHLPTAKTILDIQAEYQALISADSAAPITKATEWQWGARMMGGTYDPETGEFTGEMVQAISLLPTETISHFMATLFVKMIRGDEAAQMYLTTRDMGKALALNPSKPAKPKARTGRAATPKD